MGGLDRHHVSRRAEARLTEAVKDGALGFGEMKFHVAADSAEFQRIYALAGELGVPIMIHFQEVPHFEGEGVFATGFKQFEAMLKKYPKTRFIGHADAFWANVDARYANEAAYPAGPITRGGITDKLLGDYANLFGDLSANSGNNALSRDPQFTPDFLRRHQDKLIFGSDCSCADGKGSGVAQANNPAASRLAGKCVARETLTVLQSSASRRGLPQAGLGERSPALRIRKRSSRSATSSLFRPLSAFEACQLGAGS